MYYTLLTQPVLHLDSQIYVWKINRWKKREKNCNNSNRFETNTTAYWKLVITGFDIDFECNTNDKTHSRWFEKIKKKCFKWIDAICKNPLTHNFWTYDLNWWKAFKQVFSSSELIEIFATLLRWCLTVDWATVSTKSLYIERALKNYALPNVIAF